MFRSRCGCTTVVGSLTFMSNGGVASPLLAVVFGDVNGPRRSFRTRKLLLA